MTLRSCALAVAVALSLAGCSDRPLPVTATRVLEVAGLRAVVNAVALSPDGSLVVVGDMDGDLIAREVPAGAERWKVPVHPRGAARSRSEEHTSELQSHSDLVCRLLAEKKHAARPLTPAQRPAPP